MNNSMRLPCSRYHICILLSLHSRGTIQEGACTTTPLDANDISTALCPVNTCAQVLRMRARARELDEVFVHSWKIWQF